MLTFLNELRAGSLGHTGSSVHTSAAGALHGGGGGSFRLPGDPVRPTLGSTLSSALSTLNAKGSPGRSVPTLLHAAGSYSVWQ